MNDKMRRVLFISPQPYFQWRGSPIRVAFDAQALSEAGWMVDLVVMPVGEDHPLPNVAVHRPMNIFRINKLAIGPSAVKAFLDIFLFCTALKLAFKNRYDIIHGVEEAGAMAVVLGKLRGAKVIFEKHSDPASYKKGFVRNAVMWLYSQVEKFSIRHADAVIGTGPALVEQARKINPRITAHHIFDIPSSLVEAVPEKIAAACAKLERKPGDRIITYVGSFAVYQGIGLMFESIPPVVQARPEARFVIIGGTEQEIAERRAWLAERKSEHAVMFPGKIPPDELPNYLSASDILLSPRTSGTNTPLKLLDYLKAGRAIVACDIPANRLIVDEETALLVPADPDSFAKGIIKLLDNDPLRARLAGSGRRLVDETYNFRVFGERLKNCYDELLKR